ncbi:MAG: HlyD family efflux transporter periplasmic adaptor subunit [Rhizobiaceae bacterium]|nr:HlyD family efflux transporter periplasmic adaptor subunit [Rhizobiaceae bacterium]
MSSRSSTPASESPVSDVRPFPIKTPRPDAARLPEEAKSAPQTEAPQALPAPTEPAADTARPAKTRARKTLVLSVLGLALLGGAGWYGYDYWTAGRFMISTDDAYVQADMTYVAPKVTGYVAQRVVQENSHVKAGDPLVVLDDGDYRIAEAQAEAQIVTQGKTLERIQAQTEAARAALGQANAQRDSARAAAQNASRAVDRASKLLKTQVSTQAQLDDATTALDQANAALAGADAQIASAKANIGVLEAQYAEAQSTVRTLELTRDKAIRDLSFTVLKAPFDGVVGNLSVEAGDFVTAGQKLGVVVPLDKVYVVANFKETQLARLVPGETVRIAVDAMDDAEIEGTVSSLAPASGAVFSLLPPENATGNFTKVVQRVPVRIDVSPQAARAGHLRAGLSVVVDVDSRTAPSTN